MEEQITALSSHREEESSNNNTFPGQPERRSDQLSSKEMMILSTETMIWPHSKTKGILKEKYLGRGMVSGLKQEFASPGFFTEPARKAQEQNWHQEG